jgi:hypothetical protein
VTLLQALGYASDAWVLITYALVARFGRNARVMHYANALGAPPLIVAEIRGGLWQVLVLTGSFCALGWLGLWHTRKKHA